MTVFSFHIVYVINKGIRVLHVLFFSIQNHHQKYENNCNFLTISGSYEYFLHSLYPTRKDRRSSPTAAIFVVVRAKSDHVIFEWPQSGVKGITAYKTMLALVFTRSFPAHPAQLGATG